MNEYPEMGDETPPDPEELPDAAWLARLQTLIREATVGGPTATEFAERILMHGARLIAQTSRSGRVSGVSYEYEGHVVKGSVLGPAYTWSGLQKKLGVTYVRQRDQAAMEGLLELPAPAPAGSRDDLPGQAHAQYVHNSEPNMTAPGESSTFPTPRDAVEAKSSDESNDAGLAQDPIYEDGNRDLDGLDAEPWEAWAAELERVPFDAEAKDQALDSIEVSKSEETPAEAGVAAQASTDAAAPSVLSVEVEQWQSLITAVNELREQVRALDTGRSDFRGSESAISDGEVMREQLTALSEAVRQANQATQQATEAMNRAKHDSLWMSLIGASVAGLIAALLVGFWFNQSATRHLGETQQAIIDHMEKQAAEDPLRQYFDRIVKKLQQP